MTTERWRLLMQSGSEELTQGEIDKGWHFCPCWDGLLIGGVMLAEYLEHCYCNGKPKCGAQKVRDDQVAF